MDKIIINTNESKPEVDYSKMLSDSFVATYCCEYRYTRV